MKYLISFSIYILVLLERIYLLPFSNVRPSILIGVIRSKDEAETLFRRVYLGTIIYGLLFLNFYFLHYFGFALIFCIFALWFIVELSRRK